jgi:hypothetical protein
MTVCIAASSIFNNDPLLFFCMDMMGSTDFSSAETTWKWTPLVSGFYSLISGPISTAREITSLCRAELVDVHTENINGILDRLRDALGVYKARFADAHLRSRMGMTYEEFHREGRTALPEELFRELSYEIKAHYSSVELIIAGFITAKPVIFKISSDSVWFCEDFAVIGAGTQIAEAALFNREQSFMTGRNRSLYCVYEAKKLAEKAPGVGKKTRLYIVHPDQSMESLESPGFQVLDAHFERFAPRLMGTPLMPDDAFKYYPPVAEKQHPQSTKDDQTPQLPSPELPGESNES